MTYANRKWTDGHSLFKEKIWKKRFFFHHIINMDVLERLVLGQRERKNMIKYIIRAVFFSYPSPVCVIKFAYKSNNKKERRQCNRRLCYV